MNENFLSRAVELSRSYQTNPKLTPFGAVVAVDGQIAGEGTSSVVELCDPTAHAEVLAIREACHKLGSHLLPQAVLYCSGYPCPLCLMTCYWSQITEVYYAASLDDSAAAGFEDSYFYQQLRLDDFQRDVLVAEAGGSQLRSKAGEILRQWKLTIGASEASE